VRQCDLWYALHDSFLRRVQTDAAGSRATVSIENLTVNEFYKYPDGSEFQLCFTGVTELHVLISRRCGTALALDGSPLRRFESASWSAFEAAFTDERGPIEDGRYEYGRYQILQAHAVLEDGRVAFVIEEILDYAGFPAPASDFLSELKIVASHAEVRCPDAKLRTLDEFTALAERCWHRA
jgi:hypothetical protein